MASLSAKSKKGNVIHRTTSETLRLGGDEAINNQITGVMTRYDLEDESADDLDESHTDEISRVTDNETPSFSEDSRDDQQPLLQPVYNNQNNTISLVPPPPEEVAPPPVTKEKTKSNINDLGRFRVVKIGSMGPFSRGRWTCYDYVDDSVEAKQTLNVDNSATTRPYWETSCQPTYLYTGSILMPEPIPIYVPLITQRPMPISSQYAMPKSRVSFASCNSVDTVINNSLDANQNEQSLSNMCPILHNQKVLVAESNQEKIINYNGNTGASVSCTATIDTKIEHALDVVKNHLTHAVRIEVEELKIKINELVERISYLEYENDLLRANVTQDVLATLGNIGNRS